MTQRTYKHHRKEYQRRSKLNPKGDSTQYNLYEHIFYLPSVETGETYLLATVAVAVAVVLLADINLLEMVLTSCLGPILTRQRKSMIYKRSTRFC